MPIPFCGNRSGAGRANEGGIPEIFLTDEISGDVCSFLNDSCSKLKAVMRRVAYCALHPRQRHVAQ